MAAHPGPSFYVTVEGVNGNWVTINPKRVNLNEGAQGSILISMHQAPLENTTWLSA